MLRTMKKLADVKVVLLPNLVMLEPTCMPKGGMVVSPTYPAGFWLAACDTGFLSTILYFELKAKVGDFKRGFPLAKFEGGPIHSRKNLEQALAKAGYKPVYVNSPSWIN